VKYFFDEAAEISQMEQLFMALNYVNEFSNMKELSWLWLVL